MVPAANNPVLGFAQLELSRLRRVAGHPAGFPTDATQLLESRSRFSDLRFRPGQSPSGHCRFLEAADGVIAVNLAREEDWTLLPAWLEADETAADWNSLACAVAGRSRYALLQQGIDLGLAVALPDEEIDAVLPAIPDDSGTGDRRSGRQLRVLDLSSLWAGPLCAQLLARAGAHVTKLESVTRPDGARCGNPGFFDHLNSGKHIAWFDPSTPTGMDTLRAAIRSSDIVIESTRPRALQQLGISVEACIAEQPALTWVSVTAYGRNRFAAMRIGYGDDTGIAAGLSCALHEHTGRWDVVGDAISDPLTGIHAAASALTASCAGGGTLLDVNLVDTTRLAIEYARNELGDHGLVRALARWRSSVSC